MLNLNKFHVKLVKFKYREAIQVSSRDVTHLCSQSKVITKSHGVVRSRLLSMRSR